MRGRQYTLRQSTEDLEKEQVFIIEEKYRYAEDVAHIVRLYYYLQGTIYANPPLYHILSSRVVSCHDSNDGVDNGVSNELCFCFLLLCSDKWSNASGKLREWYMMIENSLPVMDTAGHMKMKRWKKRPTKGPRLSN